MSIAVLPFNAGADTRPTLARQFANFAAEIVRGRTGAQVNAVNYLIRVNEGNPARYANVNPSEQLNEIELVQQLFQQTESDLAMDGLLVESGNKFHLTMRLWQKGDESPVNQEVLEFDEPGVFGALRNVVEELAARSEQVLPLDSQTNTDLFGTESARALIKFMEGYDALQYIEKTQGQVVEEFRADFAFNHLLEAVEADKDWEAPYSVLLNLARSCTNFRVGTAEQIEEALKKAIELEPEDARALVVLAELYQAIGNFAEAETYLEKAKGMDETEPAIYTRLGISQASLGKNEDAEANFKKALSLENEDKPTMGFLAQLYAQTDRAKEVPALWRSIVDANPKNAHAWANLGGSLVGTGESAQGLRAFEEALEKVDEESRIIVKRAYAPALSEVQEWDKAMDLYEDCIDVAPSDIQLLLEYAQTLQNAGRTFEVPKVLRDVLGANPDPNTRAQTLSWLVELEQPKRVEAVKEAQEKMNTNDFQGAVKLLRPMRNWLADYWKMWALYASALNRIEDHREAEDASKRLIDLFPANEIGFVELGNALMAQSKIEEAYNAMRYGMATVQGSLGIALQFGLAAKRVGKLDEAKSIAEQIRQGLGEEAKNVEEALKEMESAD